MSKERFKEIVYKPFRLLTLIATAFGLSTVVDTISAQENHVEDGRPGNIFTVATGETPDYGVSGNSLNPYLAEQSATNPETVTLQESQEIASMGTIEIDFRTLNPALSDLIAVEGNPIIELNLEVDGGSIIVPVEDDNGETTQRILSLSNNTLESFLNQVATTLGDATVTVRLSQMENGEYTVTAVSDTEGGYIQFFYLTETGKTTAITAEALNDGYVPHFRVLPVEELPSNALVGRLQVDGRNFVLVTTSLQPGPGSSATEVPAQIIANNRVNAEVAATLYTASSVTNFRTAPVVNDSTRVRALNPRETLPLLNPINTDLETLKSILSSNRDITQEMLDAITISRNGLSFELNFGGHNWYIAYDNTTIQVVFITGTQSSLSATLVPEAVVIANPNTQSTPPPNTANQNNEIGTPAPSRVEVPPTVPMVNGVPIETEWRLATVEENREYVFRVTQTSTLNTNTRTMRVDGREITVYVSVNAAVTLNGEIVEMEIPIFYSYGGNSYSLGQITDTKAIFPNWIPTDAHRPTVIAAAAYNLYREQLGGWSQAEIELNPDSFLNNSNFLLGTQLNLAFSNTSLADTTVEEFSDIVSAVDQGVQNHNPASGRMIILPNRITPMPANN